jgi:hypothetical protein
MVMLFKYLLFFLFLSGNLQSKNEDALFKKVDMNVEKSTLFKKYLDSIKTIDNYQILINQKVFNLDTFKVYINDSTKFTFILQDTIIEKFDMLCLKYLVVETKKFLNLYTFDNFKRVSLTLIENGVTYKIDNIGNDHLFYVFKNFENNDRCGNEFISKNKNFKLNEKKKAETKLLESEYDECLIRICVGYLSTATTYLTKVNLRDRILEETINTNQAYENSLVDLEVEISRTVYVDDYTQGSNSVIDVCKDFASTQTLDINTIKVNYFSDMLAILMYKSDGAYGYGFFGGRPDFHYDSVVSVSRILTPNQYSFTHELAHNQGCFHNYNINNNQYPPIIYRENPYFEYGHGFYSQSISKYSIVKQNPTSGTERVLYFSNPDVIVDGVNFGEEGNMDNAKVLGKTKDWMISYKKIPVDYLLSNIFPSGETIEEADIADISAFETIDLDEDFETEIHSIVTIKAGEEVRIGPGFHAQAGSNVHAYIKDQNCYSSSKKVFADGESVIGNESKFSLAPNPTSGNAIATVEVGEKSICSLTLLDNLGNEVITIFKDKELDPGKYQYDLEANNLSNGIYLCVLRIGNSLHSEKLVYLK